MIFRPHRLKTGKILIYFLLFAFLFIPAACTLTDDTVNDGNPAEKDILKVGITPDAPPLIYKFKGEITGLEAELARELAQFSGKSLRFIEVKWNEQIPALLSGKTDIIMSGMTITDLRRVRIAFTKPYLVTGQISLVRRKDLYRFGNGLTDLMNPTIRIGTVTGTTGDYLVRETVARASSMQFRAPDQAVKALMDGSIDVFVYDLPMNLYFGSQNESKGLVPVPVPLSREFLAWGVRTEDKNLLDTANRFIEKLQQEKQLQEKIQKWIPFYKNFYNQSQG